MEAKSKQPNRLIYEKSPYLLQHAHNPVDWYPWGEEAFAKAEEEDKPVFLSIGYSTCHWCHVMNRESFEDRQVAELLNKGFVAVKVDREERPDLDHLYMSVCQAMTGSGGWPLTLLLTPERRPFFAGTYLPKNARYGRPGLLELLSLVRERWVRERSSFDEAGSRIMKELTPALSETDAGEPGPELADACYGALKGAFDQKYGGFGTAPKFPIPHQLLFLLRYWRRRGEGEALRMVEQTLRCLYRGGIYDQIGFGFCRYSTDRQWLVPHFEKMLYDNALLAYLYLEACQATGNRFYGDVAREVFSYLQREMTSPEGGFYSAEDADAEGEEGKFYLWNPEQVARVLGDEEEFFCGYYNITTMGNFEGMSIPNLIRKRREGAKERGGAGLSGHRGTGRAEGERSADGAVAHDLAGVSDYPLTAVGHPPIERGRRRLFEAREQRVHPLKDDKILTSWNGLAIAALAKGSWVLSEESYLQAAKRAADFILRQMVRPDGRLLARYRDGEAAIPGYLDDYAFLIWGLTELYQACFQVAYLEQAVSLANEMLRLFWDETDGGCYFTGSDSEDLPVRTKESEDGALPSGNSVAAYDLIRLARLTGDGQLEQRGGELLRAFAGKAAAYPAGYTFYLLALELYLSPSEELVIAAGDDEEGTAALLEVLRRHYLPGAAVLVHQGNGRNRRLARIAPYIAEQVPAGGRATAYLCRHFACAAPVTEPAALARLLTSIEK